jgi:hypothetical protein
MKSALTRRSGGLYKTLRSGYEGSSKSFYLLVNQLLPDFILIADFGSDRLDIGEQPVRINVDAV